MCTCSIHNSCIKRSIPSQEMNFGICSTEGNSVDSVYIKHENKGLGGEDEDRS